MKLNQIMLFTLIFSLCIPAITCLAGDGQSLLGFGPRIGLMKSKDSEDVNTLIGGFVRLTLIPAFTAELAADYRKSDIEDTDIEMRQIPVYASGIFNLYSNKQATPYIIAGIGWYNVKLEGDGLEETQREVGYHIGGGLNAPLSENVVFTGDFKYNFLEITVDESDQEIDSKGWIINVGLAFYM